MTPPELTPATQARLAALRDNGHEVRFEDSAQARCCRIHRGGEVVAEGHGADDEAAALDALQSFDLVEEASIESFPASDPPPFGGSV